MSIEHIKQFIPGYPEDEVLPESNIETEDEDLVPEEQPVIEEVPQQSDRIAGEGGTVRDPIGAISDTLVDVVDNLFQGDQRSREDITTQRKETTAAKREENRTRDKNFGDVLAEPGRIVAGATTGFAEGLLEAGEIVGDVAKLPFTHPGSPLAVFPSLYNETQDPFSSKYDWVKWDLGKDDQGAQTAAGRVIQGFGEFGLTLYATGGFKSIAGAGLKLNQLQQARTATGLLRAIPNKKQFLTILKAGTQEGLTGIAADLVTAASGEGNLSNLIRDNFPELLPLWATALAIDEDDNPFEAAFKTALEGHGLGTFIGSAGAYLSGARAIRRFRKAKLSDLELKAIGLEAATKKLFHGTSPRSARLIKEEGFTKTPGATGTGVYFGTDEKLAKQYAMADDPDLAKLSDAEYKDNLRRYGTGGPGIDDGEGEVISGFLPPGSKILDVTESGLSFKKWTELKGEDPFIYAREKGYQGVRFDIHNGAETFLFDEKVASQISQYSSFIDQIGRIGGDVISSALENGNTVRFEKFEKLLAQRSKEIPITYDDVADVFPEYFTPGNREVQATFTPILDQLIKDQSPGFTINPFTGESPTKGFSVAIDGTSIEKFDAESIAAFIAKNKDVLSRDDVYLGGWFDPDLNKPIIELSRIVPDGKEAGILGRLFDQKAIVQIDGDEVVELTTYGADQLKKTKGLHISQSINRPSEANTTSINKAYQQIRQADATDLGGGSQRTLTNSQIHLLSDGDAAQKQILDELNDNFRMNEGDLAKAAQLTEDQLRQEASNIVGDAIGVNGQIDWKKLPRTSDDLLDPVGVVAMRMIIKELAQNLANLGSAVTKNADNGIEYAAQFDLLGANLKAAARMHKRSANLWSAGLRAHGVKIQKNIDGLNFKPPTIDEIEAEKLLNQNTLAKEIQELDKTIDQITTGLKSGDQVARKKALQTAVALELSGGDITKTLNVWKAVRDVGTENWLSIMYNSLLSSPATHIVNTLSNAFNTVYRPLTLYYGGGAKEKAQALKGFYNFQDTLNASWETAWATLKDNKPVNPGQKGYKQVGDSDRQLAELVEIAERSEDEALQRGVGFLQWQKDIVDYPLFNWPSRFLSTSDEFFKVMVARMEYNQQIMGKAIDAAELSGQPVEEAFKALHKSEFSRNFTTKNAILNPDLIDAAKQVTFQTELTGIAKQFGDFVNSVPPLKIFFPFVRTGHNILAYTATHVPLLNRAFVQEYKSVMQGTDEYAKAMMRGREAVGRNVIITAGFAAATGLITGNGPADPKEREVWLLSNRPRSIRLPGGQWLDYSRIEPFGMLLSATADLVDYAKKYPLQQKKWEYLGGQLTWIVAANVTNKSFLQGLSPLGKILSPGWQGASSFGKIGPEIINNSIPLAGARRALSNAINPYMQEYDSNLNRLLEQATGGIIGIGAADDYDFTTGERLESTSGNLDAFSPLKLTKRGDSPVKDALEDISFDSSVIVESITGVDLNVQQQARMKQLMGQSDLNAELEKIVTNKGWKKAKNEWYRSNIFNGKSKKNTWWYQQVEGTILKYRDRAKAVVIQESKGLQRDLLQQSKDKQLPRSNPSTGILDFSLLQ